MSDPSCSCAACSSPALSRAALRARKGRSQDARLIELAADDAALTRHDRWALANALVSMAEHRAPTAGLAAVGQHGPGGVVERVSRLLDQKPSLSTPTVTAGAAALAIGATTPLIAVLAPVLLLPVVVCGT